MFIFFPPSFIWILHPLFFHCSVESIEWLKKASGSGAQTRCSLARTLCELEQWKNSAGKPCLASARKALPKIAREAGFSLPQPKPMVTSIPTGAASVDVAAGFPDNRATCRIDELEAISLEIVRGEDKTLWRSMMTHTRALDKEKSIVVSCFRGYFWYRGEEKWSLYKTF